MTTQELKEYLKDVYELEKQKYTYQKIAELYEDCIDELQSSGNELKKYELYRGEIDPYNNNPTLPKPNEIKLDYNCPSGNYNHLASILWRLQEGETKKKLHDIIWKKDNTSLNIAKKLIIAIMILSVLYGISSGKLIFSIIIGAIIAIVLFCLLIVALEELNYIRPNSKTHILFLEEYTKWYDAELEKKKQFVIPKLEILTKEYLEHVHENAKKTNDLLKKVYSKKIIHKKYQNFIAVSQIYEYLDTGRCTTLEGPFGAYNLFEKELRMDIIIDELDTIICQLDSLNASMHMMVNAIEKTNGILSGISSQLSQINANAELIAYNTDCISFNSNIMSKYY